MCVSDLGHNWSRQWLVAYSAPSLYLKQCWLIVNCTHGNILQWNLKRNYIIFIQEKINNWKCRLPTIAYMTWFYEYMTNEGIIDIFHFVLHMKFLDFVLKYTLYIYQKSFWPPQTPINTFNRTIFPLSTPGIKFLYGISAPQKLFVVA